MGLHFLVSLIARLVALYFLNLWQDNPSDDEDAENAEQKEKRVTSVASEKELEGSLWEGGLEEGDVETHWIDQLKRKGLFEKAAQAVISNSEPTTSPAMRTTTNSSTKKMPTIPLQTLFRNAMKGAIAYSEQVSEGIFLFGDYLYTIADDSDSEPGDQSAQGR